jgi:cytochrome c biogenesis protein CcmG/thiol:disulfide interchange protein DsbE
MKSRLLGMKNRLFSLDGILMASFWVAMLALIQLVRVSVEHRVAVVGEQAPAFSIQTDDGRTVSRDDPGRKLLIVNFWATWCPPCIAEMPSLNALARELKDRGVVVVGVSIDEQEEPYRRFIEKMQPQFLTSRDAQGDLAGEFGTLKIPETYIIGPDGRVLEKYIDARDWMDPALRAEIRRFARE